MGEKTRLFTNSSTNRAVWYISAFVLRMIISAIFIDQHDGPVFLQTTQDIIVNGTKIYYEGSLHNDFNYFPLAYLFVLPGMYIYYFLGLDNVVLARIFLRLPTNCADLFLAGLIRQLIGEDPVEQFTFDETKSYELFILFNPILIYTGAYKGQFDVFVGIFFVLSWISLRQKNYLGSGTYAALALLSKPYAVIPIFYVYLYLVKEREYMRYTAGLLLGSIPVILIGLLMNSDGMIDHAIVFHLSRTPDGFSLTSILVNTVSISSGSKSSQIQGITLVMTILLVFVLIYLAYKLISQETRQADLLLIAIKGYVIFLLLNKVFWLQYLVLLLVLIVVYRIEQQQVMWTGLVAWEMNLIPLVLAMRVVFFVPKDIRDTMGSDWYDIVWIVCVFIHFLILCFQGLGGRITLINRKYALTYLLIFFLFLMSYFYHKINFLQ